MKKTLYFIIGIMIIYPVMGKIVITEIYANAVGGSEAGHEWVEIYNGGNASVDLTAWSFSDATREEKLTAFQDSIVLEPAGFAVIADDPLTFISDYSYEGAVLDAEWNSLKNTGETLSLKNPAAAIEDQVSYTSIANADGYSIELLNPFLDNDDMANWRVSSVFGGTPGTGPWSEEAQDPSAQPEIPEFNSIGLFLMGLIGLMYLINKFPI